MTSSIPLLLPLKASEAASLADLVFQQLGGKAITDEQRHRLGPRAASLGLTSIRPYWGSLQADPFHAQTYYLAVDAVSPAETVPLLLRMALSSAPASGLFPNAMLIGRMRPGGGREVVVNAIPFGPRDTGAVMTFANSLDRAVLPRPAGAQPLLCVAPADPVVSLPAAFEGFRAAYKATGLNYASIEVAPDKFTAVVWAAIRAGWREGYTAGAGWLHVDPAAPASMELAIHDTAAFSRFSLDFSAFSGLAQAVEACQQLYDFIRREKAINKTGRAFDLEVNPGGLPVEELLQRLRAEGRPAHLVAVPVDRATPELAQALRPLGAILSVAAPGRWHWRYAGDLTADELDSLLGQLRG